MCCSCLESREKDRLAQGLLPAILGRASPPAPGQKLIKSSCDISKRPVACFHSLVFAKSSAGVTFFFSRVCRVWVMCGSGGCWKAPQVAHRRDREPLTSSTQSPNLLGVLLLSALCWAPTVTIWELLSTFRSWPPQAHSLAGADPPDSWAFALVSPPSSHLQRASQVPTGCPLRASQQAFPLPHLLPIPQLPDLTLS